jgi:7-cyano-7-deazaguanine synthase in queuosine biosynthesis
MKRSLILCSGGMKSMLLAVAAAKESTPILVYLDNDSKARENELEASSMIASYVKGELVILKAPEEALMQIEITSMIMQLCWLMPYAKVLGCSEIHHGFCRDQYRGLLAKEHDIEKFISTLSSLASLLQPATSFEEDYIPAVTFELPLYRLTLRHILQLGKQWYIPWDLTWSCEEGHSFSCGQCPKCALRKRAFFYEEMIDPLIYER